MSKFIDLCDICSLLRPRKSRVLRPLAQHECFSENTSSGNVVKATKHLKPKANSGKNGEKQQDGMATNGKKREQGTSTGGFLDTVCSELELSTPMIEKQMVSKNSSVSNEDKENDADGNGAS